MGRRADPGVLAAGAGRLPPFQADEFIQTVLGVPEEPFSDEDWIRRVALSPGLVQVIG